MQDLQLLLSWRSPEYVSRQCKNLRGQHQAAVAIAIGHAFSEAERSVDDSIARRATRARAAFATLPTDGMLRIIDAPETCYRIGQSRTQGVAGLVQFLEQVITAEQLRIADLKSSTRAVWSAMGDRYYPSHSNEPADPALDCWLRDATSPYAAPIKNGLTIDFFSPYAQRPLEHNNFRPEFSKPTTYSSSEIEIITRRITGAITGLNQIGGGPIEFVEQMLKTLMPRREPLAPEFKGGSNRAFLGRANLFNPHLDYIEMANIANSLVHEAIHTFMYLVEQQVMPVEDPKVLYQDMIESPWSGKEIHLLAYIHASFVWYGLYHFWHLPTAGQIFGGAVRDHYIRFTQKGYQNGEMFQRLQRFRDHIRPDLMDQLSRLQASFS